jgi:hypothetical protein
MDLGDITRLALLASAAFAFGRLVASLAHLIERQTSSMRDLAPEEDERLRALEEECNTLRQEVTEIAERQDFTERTLAQNQGRARPFLRGSSRAHGDTTLIVGCNSAALSAYAGLAASAPGLTCSGTHQYSSTSGRNRPSA